MISEEEALARILAQVAPGAVDGVSLLDALGRYSAADIVARLASPLFTNSSMDGFAVRAADTRNGAPLRLAGLQPAGPDRALELGPGEAIRIFTGAPVPAGADAVVMQEDVEVDGAAVVVKTETQSGENIRRRGEDLCEGQLILKRGDQVMPQTIGVLAAQGISRVKTHRCPRVAILSTGDELIPAGEALSAGKIYESNGPMLTALVTSAGAKAVPLGISPDEPDELRSRLTEGLGQDVLVVSGGVSVGDRDAVKAELTRLGVSIDLWRVAMKPGKPFAFGCRDSCLVFGLPGNPVSAFVTFLQFVRPALLKMMGAREVSLPQLPAMAGAELFNASDRPHYLRGVLREGMFHPFGRQESHALFGLSRSNALLRLAPGERVCEGGAVRVLIWDVPGGA